KTLLQTDTPSLSISLRLLAAGSVSCTVMNIFGGTRQDFIATFLVGVIGYARYLFTQKLFQVPYLDSFAAAFVIGLLAY
ncbi:threonine/serine exporter family protein, partial [Enterococcus faecalis]|uniref:threonine/serine exporter family protein n=1 Tax=Enterococcus faecalis TaxID=1351 RepID=UPI003CC65397